MNLVFNYLSSGNCLRQFVLFNLQTCMISNAQKTKCNLFNRNLRIKSPNNKQCQRTKILESLTSNLKWSVHSQDRLTNASNAFYQLKHHIPWNTASSTKLNLYKCLVASVLTYGIPAASPDTMFIFNSESFQIIFARNATIFRKLPLHFCVNEFL